MAKPTFTFEDYSTPGNTLFDLYQYYLNPTDTATTTAANTGISSIFYPQVSGDGQAGDNISPLTNTIPQQQMLTPEQKAMNKRIGSKLLGGLFVSTMMVGGIMGMPFGDNLRQIIRWFTKEANMHGFDLEVGIRETLIEFGLGGAVVDILTRGPLSKLSGIDVSKRMTITEVLPLDLLSNDLTAATGPAGGIFIDSIKRAHMAFENMGHGDGGDSVRFITSFFPLAARNFVDASMSLYDPSKPIRTSQGRVIMPGEELGKLENVVRMLGFTPHTLRQKRLQKQYINQLDQKTIGIQDYYYSQIAKVLARRKKLYDSGDKKGAEKASKIIESIWKDIQEINEKAIESDRPEKIININSEALRNRILVEIFGQSNIGVASQSVRKLARGLITDENFRNLGLK